MELTDAVKKQIEDMDYEHMLRLWRYASAGHPMFQGESGKYYSKIMAEKRNNSEHVAISKRLG